jgi:hypothetical protein
MMAVTHMPAIIHGHVVTSLRIALRVVQQRRCRRPGNRRNERAPTFSGWLLQGRVGRGSSAPRVPQGRCLCSVGSEC